MTLKTIFVDVGGVLLTNGWDKDLRNKAATNFSLDPNELQARHQMVVEDYERGKIKIEEYLEHIVFYTKRPFTMSQFKDFMFINSRPYPEMLELIKKTKANQNVKIAILSNEAAEIAQYRFKKFNFDQFVDYYIVSAFVNVLKPDLRIYQFALGLCQNKPNEVIFIDDRIENIYPAQSLGIPTIHHTSYETTAILLHAK